MAGSSIVYGNHWSNTQSSNASSLSVTTSGTFDGDTTAIIAHYGAGTIASVTIGGVACTSVGSYGELRIFKCGQFNTALSSPQVVITYTGTSSQSIAYVVRIQSADASITQIASGTGESTTPSSGATGTIERTWSMLLGFIGTEGPSTDAAGTWSNSFTDRLRTGSAGLTLSVGSRYLYRSTTPSAAAKTGIEERVWVAMVVVIRPRHTLSQTLYPASGRTETFQTTYGTHATTVAATVAQMKDGSDSTFDATSLIDDEINGGISDVFVRWTMDPCTVLGTIDLVNLDIRAKRVDQSAGPHTFNVAGCYDTTQWGSYTAISTSWGAPYFGGASVAKDTINSRKWGYRAELLINGLGGYEVESYVSEFKVEIYSVPSVEVTPSAVTIAASTATPTCEYHEWDMVRTLKGTASTTTNATSISVAGVNVAASNVLLVVVAHHSGSISSATWGGTNLTLFYATTRCAIYWARSNGKTGDVVANLSGAQVANMRVYELEGVEATALNNPGDNKSLASAYLSSATNITTATTVAPDFEMRLVFGFFVFAGGSSTPDPQPILSPVDTITGAGIVRDKTNITNGTDHLSVVEAFGAGINSKTVTEGLTGSWASARNTTLVLLVLKSRATVTNSVHANNPYTNWWDAFSGEVLEVTAPGTGHMQDNVDTTKSALRINASEETCDGRAGAFYTLPAISPSTGRMVMLRRWMQYRKVTVVSPAASLTMGIGRGTGVVLSGHQPTITTSWVWTRWTLTKIDGSRLVNSDLTSQKWGWIVGNPTAFSLAYPGVTDVEVAENHNYAYVIPQIEATPSALTLTATLGTPRLDREQRVSAVAATATLGTPRLDREQRVSAVSLSGASSTPALTYTQVAPAAASIVASAPAPAITAPHHLVAPPSVAISFPTPTVEVGQAAAQQAALSLSMKPGWPSVGTGTFVAPVALTIAFSHVSIGSVMITNPGAMSLLSDATGVRLYPIEAPVNSIYYDGTSLGDGDILSGAHQVTILDGFASGQTWKVYETMVAIEDMAENPVTITSIEVTLAIMFATDAVSPATYPTFVGDTHVVIYLDGFESIHQISMPAKVSFFSETQGYDANRFAPNPPPMLDGNIIRTTGQILTQPNGLPWTREAVNRMVIGVRQYALGNSGGPQFGRVLKQYIAEAWIDVAGVIENDPASEEIVFAEAEARETSGTVLIDDTDRPTVTAVVGEEFS
jgi:hypothetical protein